MYFALITVRRLGSWDYLALALYFAVNIAIGLWCGRKKQSADDYLRGGGRISWVAAGVSFFATGTSSISFMAIPAKTYATNWLSFGSAIAQVGATLVVAYGFVGLLRRLNLTTIFTYLELRFSLKVRLLGAGLAVLLKICGRMSVIMLLPALALSTVTGLNVYLSIVLLGSVTVLYSMIGGFEAVIWTDVMQVIVMFGGVALALTAIAHGVDGGLAGILHLASASGRLDAISWDFNLKDSTVWVFMAMAFGSVFTQLSDQPLMQRVFSTEGDKAARRTVALGGWMGLPSAVVFFFVGTALAVFYQVHADRLNPELPNDAIFPFFIVNELPPGVVGLIIASLFAAAMGSLSSTVNATAAIVVGDFYGRLQPGASDGAKVRLARTTTVVAGAVATGMAAYVASLGVASLWDQFLKLIALIGGGFPGVFALGLLTRRANSTGVIVGAVTSIAITWWIQSYTPWSVFFQGFAAVASCMVTGYVVSCLTRGSTPQPDLRGLTVWDLPAPFSGVPASSAADFGRLPPRSLPLR